LALTDLPSEFEISLTDRLGVDDEQPAALSLNRHDLEQLAMLVRAQEHEPGILQRRVFGAFSSKITLEVSMM